MLTALLLTFAPTASAGGDGIKEAVAISEQNYQYSDCYHIYPNLPYSWAISGAWKSEIATWSFGKNDELKDLTPEQNDLEDVDMRSRGTDASSEGIDTYDIALIVAYGGLFSDHARSSIEMMDVDGTDQNCYSDLSADIMWGDTDLNQVFAVVSQSGNAEVFDSGGYNNLDDPTSAFDLYAGFHGDFTQRSGTDNDMADFTNLSQSSGVGDHWIGEMIRTPLGADNDSCPTVVVYGQDATHNATYFHDAGLDNYTVSSGSNHDHLTFFFPGGCDLMNWHPTATGRSYTITDSLMPLAGHRNDITVLSGSLVMGVSVPLMNLYSPTPSSSAMLAMKK